MSRIKEVALVLYKELARDRFYFFLALASGGIIMATLFPTKSPATLVERIGLPALDVLPFVVLIFWGMALFDRETFLENGRFIFARPVKKWEYLAGSVLAVLLAVLLVILVVLGICFLFALFDNGPEPAGILLAGLFAFLQSCLLLTFGLFFALLVPRQLAMALFFFVYALGHSIDQLAGYLYAPGNIVVKYLGNVLLPFIPNLEFFNQGAAIMAGVPVSIYYFFHLTLYALSYSLLIFLLSIYIFSRINVESEKE